MGQKNFRHKVFDSISISGIRHHLASRMEIGSKVSEIFNNKKNDNPLEIFCIFRFGAAKDGLDVEIGVKTTENIPQSTVLADIKAISFIHKNGDQKSIGDSIQEAYIYASENKFIVDGYYIEIWRKNGDIEILIPLHDWNSLFILNLKKRVCGEKFKEITKNLNETDVFDPIEKRFEWAKKATINLEYESNKNDYYEVVSRCAHVFPVILIKKARKQFESNQNIDDLFDYMRNESGWYGSFKKVGNKIITWKNPVNPKAFDEAKSKAEKIQAYCFCPIVKHNPDEIPHKFCNCSAGWVRQLWEGIFGSEIRVNVDETIISGGEKCSFSFEIP